MNRRDVLEVSIFAGDRLVFSDEIDCEGGLSLDDAPELVGRHQQIAAYLLEGGAAVRVLLHDPAGDLPDVLMELEPRAAN